MYLSVELVLNYVKTLAFRGTANGLFRGTSTTGLRARDHYMSSTLNGGKGGAGPSSLHTTLEGPTEHVNARWM